MFTVNMTLSVGSIQSTILSGLGYLNTAMRVYQTASFWYGCAQDVITVYTYAQLAVSFLKAFMVSSPQGAAMTLANEIMKLAGEKVNALSILDAFEQMLRELSKDWDDISRAIAQDAPKIAAEVVLEFTPRIPQYAAKEKAGLLKPILLLPTGPVDTEVNKNRTGDKLIPIGDAYLGLSVRGGRLFGFEFLTSADKGFGDQLFRIDYWDSRAYQPISSPLYNAQANRPTKTPLHVHYHIGTDQKGNNHYPNRTIWPK